MFYFCYFPTQQPAILPVHCIHCDHTINVVCNESTTTALFSFFILLSHHFLFHQAKGKKRQIGWFPATYVKVLGGSSRSTPVSMELTGREDAPPDTTTTPTSAPTSASTAIAQVTVTPPTDEPMKGPNDASNGERPKETEILREGGMNRERKLEGRMDLQRESWREREEWTGTLKMEGKGWLLLVREGGRKRKEC